jgi:hypothetical protein
MVKFRRKASVVEAVQWFKPGDHPAVECRTIGGETEIPHVKHLMGGHIVVRPGDWIVTGETDCPGVYAPVAFEGLFEAAEEEGAR